MFLKKFGLFLEKSEEEIILGQASEDESAALELRFRADLCDNIGDHEHARELIKLAEHLEVESASKKRRARSIRDN